MRKFLSNIYCENLVKLLEVNLTVFQGCLYDWVLLDYFLTPRLVHTKPLVIFQLRLPLRISYTSLVPTVVFAY